MNYFDSDAYETLLNKATVGAIGNIDDDLCIVSESTDSLIQYVYVVCRGENILNAAKERDTSVVEAYDCKRHTAHENAILSAKVLNRIAEAYGSGDVFKGNPNDRHQVAEFCLELVSWLFSNRRKVL